MDSFKTDRLTAARLRAEHYDLLCRMHRDATVMATLNGVRTDEQTQAFLDENLGYWDRRGFGLWIFNDRQNGAFVGRAGLRPVEVVGRAEVEVAYALMDDYWGRGLASEIAARLLSIGFENVGLNEIVCYTWAENLASQRVMQKVGFRYERDFVHADAPHVLYRLTAAEWRALQS